MAAGDGLASAVATGRPALASALRGPVYVGILLLAWISTAPFKGSYAVDPAESSNLANQIAFSLTAVLALAVAAASGAGRPARAYLRPSWLLFLGWMGFGVLTSLNPDISMRALRFSLVVLAIGGAAVLLPEGRRRFAALTGAAVLIVLFVCYAGLVLVPDIAIHSAADPLEPEHAGSWRGLFDHKNVAGAMMVIFLFVGIHVARAGPRGLGLAVALLAGLFLFQTGSKTSMALAPAILLIAWACARIDNLAMRLLLTLTPLAVLMTATLGSVLFAPVGELLQALSPGQTFTGRTEIWKFAFDRLWERPLTGYGFEGFWGSDFVRQAEIREGETGIAQGMVHGHSGYVDLAIGMGLPGFALGLTILVVLPLVDFHRAVRLKANREMAFLFLCIWLFAIYSACLESFFFRRADPVWFAMLLSVLGLRLLSRYRTAP